MTIKIKVFGSFTKLVDGRYTTSFTIVKAPLHFEAEPNYDPDLPVPTIVKMRQIGVGEKYFDSSVLGDYTISFWSYRGSVMSAKCEPLDSVDDIPVAIESMVLRNERAIENKRREVESQKRVRAIGAIRREKLSEAVKLFVWQRDLGKCVKCGVSEKLEFDHIIPLSKGGSDTERNIQLLCEGCNRSKGAVL